MERGIILLTLLAIVQSELINLSCDQIKEFVNEHNTRRLRVANGEIPNQPAAEEMNYLAWDEELAVKAAKRASRHNFEPNATTKHDSHRIRIGQNFLSYSTKNQSSNLNVQTVVDYWFDEYKNYSYRPIEKDDFERFGHFTQIIWSNTLSVGCAATVKNINGLRIYFVVCKYSPKGNILGETPYRAGKASGRLVCGTSDCSRLYGSCD